MEEVRRSLLAAFEAAADPEPGPPSPLPSLAPGPAAGPRAAEPRAAAARPEAARPQAAEPGAAASPPPRLTADAGEEVVLEEGGGGSPGPLTIVRHRPAAAVVARPGRSEHEAPNQPQGRWLLGRGVGNPCGASGVRDVGAPKEAPTPRTPCGWSGRGGAQVAPAPQGQAAKTASGGGSGGGGGGTLPPAASPPEAVPGTLRCGGRLGEE